MHGTAPRPVHRFLFLQGMPTHFFDRFGQALAKRGHGVRRVNFTAGDRLYWNGPGAVDYRGDLAGWPKYLEKCLKDWHITEVVLFGDWRPLHAAAIRIATLRGLAVHVFEEGYLRPNWITLEHGGVNNNSALPREPEWFLHQAATLPEWDGGKPVQCSFTQRALQDLVYQYWSMAFAWRYRRYRSHLPLHPLREYIGWMGRFLRAGKNRKLTQRGLETLVAADKPFFVFPLQLDADSQLRINSSFGRLAPAIETVLTSFAQHAPSEALLVVKEHPLDPQLHDWRAKVEASAARLGIAGRVIYLVGGDMAALAQRSQGLVTVNSTSGILALSAAVPVVTLGSPVYDMRGLTFQHGLDRFWTEAQAPNPVLFDAFRRVVADRTQINGGYFSSQGVEMAVQGAIARVESGRFEPAMVHTAASTQDSGDMLDGDIALAQGRSR